MSWLSATDLAKSFMHLCESFPPSPHEETRDCMELIYHPVNIGSPELFLLKLAQWCYDDERNFPWDLYFGTDLISFLRKKNVLEVGCSAGGRSKAWIERYQFLSYTGIDVKQTILQAGKRFVKHVDIETNFCAAKAEDLPFSDETFDAVLSFQVFEHVQNVQHALSECHRVLKRQGRLFIVLPGHFHPLAHHLLAVTRTPCIHYFFSGKTLIKAYDEIIRERGDDALWYRRESYDLESWERGHQINGITHAQFRKYIKNNWRIIRHSRKPIGSIGRNASKIKIYKMISYLFLPLVLVPFANEIFLHRITYILEKKATDGCSPTLTP